MNAPEGVVPGPPPPGVVPGAPKGIAPSPHAGASPPSDPNSVQIPTFPAVTGPLRAAGSGIETASDYFTAALLSPENASARDLHYQAEQRAKLRGQDLVRFNTQVAANQAEGWPNRAFIKHTIQTKGWGPSAAHAIAGQEGLTDLGGFGPGTFLDKAPTWVKAGVEIGEGFALPTGEITGPIAGLAGRGTKAATGAFGAAAAKIAPETTHKIQAIKEGIAPFSGLRRAAIRAGKPQLADAAEQAGRTYKNAENTAKHSAALVAQKFYGGLTKEERIEVERLSENYGPKGVVNPPALPDPDGKLWLRSKQVRAVYLDTTEKLRDFGFLRDKHTPATAPGVLTSAPVMSDPHTYSYRGGGVYNRSSLTRKEEELLQATKGAAPRRQAGFDIGQERKKAKEFDFYDQAKASGMLSDEYDPAKQLRAYVERSYTSLHKEQAVRDLKSMGILDDFIVRDPQSGIILGSGKTGAQAAAATGRATAQGKAYTEAQGVVNTMRAARGEAPLTPPQIAAMQRAVAGKGRTLRALQAANQAQRTTGALAARTAKAANQVTQRTGAELLSQLNAKTQAVDKLNAHIDAFRTKAVANDKGAAAKQLTKMVEARDRAAQQVEDMRTAVEQQAQEALGIRHAERPGFEHTTQDAFLKRNRVPVSTSRQGGVRVPLGNSTVKTGISNIYAPVVGRLQEIRQTALGLPSGPIRGKVLQQLNALGERALHAPGKTAAAAERHGDRMLKHLQRAMGTVAQAGKDPTAQQMIADLQRTAAQMTADITRQSKTLYGRRDVIVKPAQQAAAIVAGADTKAAKKAQALLAQYDAARIAAPDMLAFKRAFSSAIVGRTARETEKIIGESERDALRHSERAFAQEATSAVPGSPSAQFAVARREVIRFFQAQGAQPGDAHSVSQFIDGMNSLARVGMITNPVIHAGWNLGTHFLAAGGPIDFMGTRLWQDPKDWAPAFSRYFGRDAGGHEWEALADENNALMHTPMTHGMFKDTSYVGPAILSKSGIAERGAKGTADAATAALWNWNQKVVFDQAETRYATELFRHFVENKNMTPAGAGIAVRKALGDYTNVSRTGIDQALRRGLFFYGWLKSALPFWIGTIAREPKAFAAPTRAELIYNQAAGDPDPRTGRIFEGLDANGQAMYRTDPGPWKYAADVLEMAAPAGDPSEAGIESFGKGGLKLLQSHLTPFGIGGGVNASITLGKTMAAGPQEPTQANQFDVMFNKGESPGVVAGQVAAYGTHNLPFLSMGQGIGEAFSRLAHRDARGMLSAVGGTEYTNTDPTASRQVYKAEARLARDLSRAKKVAKDDPDSAAQMRKEARERYEQRVRDAQAPTASPSGVVVGPPPGVVQGGAPAGIVAGPPPGIIAGP